MKPFPAANAACLATLLALLLAACSVRDTDVANAPPAASEVGGPLVAAPPVLDGHVDMLVHLAQEDYSGWKPLGSVDLVEHGPGQVDLARLRRGGSTGGIFTIAALGDGDAGQRLQRAVGILHALGEANPGWKVAASAKDVEAALASGRVALLPGLEGSEQLGEGDPERLIETARDAGVRSVGLTWTRTNVAGDAAGATPRHDGLGPQGEAMVRAMNRHGLVVDLSHAADSTVRDALAIARAPVLFSHSSARALCDSPRNLPDDLLREVAKNGGLVMVSFVPYLTRTDYLRWYEAGEAEWARLKTTHNGETQAAQAAMTQWETNNPAPTVTVEDVADHVEHIRKVAGIDHVGIGSDFDGMYSHVDGLEDAAEYPALFEVLRRRGWDEASLEKLAYRNFLRLLRDVEAEALRPASDTPTA